MTFAEEGAQEALSLPDHEDLLTSAVLRPLALKHNWVEALPPSFFLPELASKPCQSGAGIRPGFGRGLFVELALPVAPSKPLPLRGKGFHGPP